jgi:LysM repeat protein/ABC-type branched-subunit amino acid transport system substrate-binding protein
MGVAFRFIFISAFFLGVFSVGNAQDWPQETIEGKDYYVHYVAPGNTLYAISKKYTVTISDLISANPGAQEGLSIGDRILIPVDAIDKKTLKKQEVKLDGEAILHTVQKKETLFSISRKYGVDLNDLTAANPEAATSLRTGSVLRIPIVTSTQTDSVFLSPAVSDTFVVHQVQAGDTPYNLAKYYEISLDSLNRANDDFKDGLRAGTWITIPRYSESFLASQVGTEVPESKSPYANEGLASKYSLGFMLPFEVMVNDSLEKSLKMGKDLYLLTEIALEYYRGVKLALDSLKKKGFSADVHVYDVGEDLVGARDVVRRPEIKDLDVIFGPMHKASLAMVSDVSKENGTYLVSPNSFSNEIFEDNPYLLRARASRETMMRYLANYIAINHQYQNVVMVNSGSPKDYPYVQQFSNYYSAAIGTFPNYLSDSLETVTKKQINVDEIGNHLRKDTLNILVVPSNDLAFVSDFITRLARVADPEYKIQVYGLDNWIRYDNIDAAYKNRFRLRLVLPTYVDYSAPDVIKFLQKYREEYGMEPAFFDYGFQGYDLMMYVGEALLRYGKGFPNYLDQIEIDGLAATYRFGKSTTGSELENKAVTILEYNNYNIEIKN